MEIIITEEITEVCRSKWLVPYTIFDKIDVNDENASPFSLGISGRADTISQTHDIASSALDMALGRGRDQYMIKRNNRFTFYGGKSKAIEKNSW